MSSTLVDLVKIVASNSGSGAIVLGAAVDGYRGREKLLNGATYSYSIQQGSQFEFGTGLYVEVGNLLVRSPQDSSNGGTAINLSPGAEVAFVALANDILARDVLQPLYGNGAPLSGAGQLGQVYYDLNAPVTLYGPKTDAGWGVGVSLQGANGNNGATVADLAGLKAVPIIGTTPPTNLSGAWYFWTTGNFTGQADNVNVVKADSTALTAGAWVRQKATSTAFQASAPAIIRDVQSKLLDYPVTPKDRGAIGDGVADDTAALQAYATANFPAAWLGDNLVYRITDTVAFPANLPVDFGTSKIVYDGTRNRPAVVIGASGSPNLAPIKRAWVESSAISVASDAYVGLQMFNCQRNLITIRKARGFARNIEAVAKGFGFTGATIRIADIGDGQYAFTSTCDGNVNETYFNSNGVYIGDWSIVTPSAGDAYGWHARQINGALQNQTGNDFAFGGLQPADGNVGETRCAFLLEGTGAYNKIYLGRYESGRGPLGRVVGPAGDNISASPVVVENEVVVGMLATSAIIQPIVSEEGSGRLTNLRFDRDHTVASSRVTIDSIHKKVRGYSTTDITAFGGLHVTGGDGEPVLNVSAGGVETEIDCLRMLGVDRSVGFFVDIDGGESFTVWARTKAGFPGLLGVAAYDANGARMAYTSGLPAIKSDIVGSQYNRWTTNMGGCYQTGSQVDSWAFTASTSVKRLRVFFQNGKLQALGIVRSTPTDTPLASSSGLSANDYVSFCSGQPIGSGVGVWQKGDVAYLTSASGAGLDGYQATTGGTDVKAWTISTAYAIGQLRTNDSGKVYQVATAGTSASSGGPTGTGGSISDGTVTWKYVGTLAVATLV